MFEKIYNEAISEFKKEYGEKKYNIIYSKVVNSSSYKKNLPVLIAQLRPPNATQLLVVIQNIPFFAFSSKKNTAIGGSILLNNWNLICNSNNSLCNDEELLIILESLFGKSSGLLW